MNRNRPLIVFAVVWSIVILAGMIAVLVRERKGAPPRGGGALAIVKIYGALHTNMSASPWEGPDADSIAQRLHKLSEDDSVKAILLRINSPGGTVGAVQEIDTEIQRCRAKGKKIIASLGDVAASGGYYLAASADHVVSNPGTITGSIGVILEFGNLEGLMQKFGVKLEVIKSGAHKDIGSPARPLTAEERALLQSSIDDAYDQFLQAVAKGRHKSIDVIRPLADGRIFTGRQALQVGLVDQLGNEQDAIQKAIELAHLPAHPRIISGERRSFGGLLQHMTSEFTSHAWEAASDLLGSPSVEYRWR